MPHESSKNHKKNKERNLSQHLNSAHKSFKVRKPHDSPVKESVKLPYKQETDFEDEAYVTDETSRLSEKECNEDQQMTYSDYPSKKCESANKSEQVIAYNSGASSTQGCANNSSFLHHKMTSDSERGQLKSPTPPPGIQGRKGNSQTSNPVMSDDSEEEGEVKNASPDSPLQQTPRRPSPYCSSGEGSSKSNYGLKCMAAKRNYESSHESSVSQRSELYHEQRSPRISATYRRSKRTLDIPLTSDRSRGKSPALDYGRELDHLKKLMLIETERQQRLRDNEINRMLPRNYQLNVNSDISDSEGRTYHEKNRALPKAYQKNMNSDSSSEKNTYLGSPHHTQKESYSSSDSETRGNRQKDCSKYERSRRNERQSPYKLYGSHKRSHIEEEGMHDSPPGAPSTRSRNEYRAIYPKKRYRRRSRTSYSRVSSRSPSRSPERFAKMNLLPGRVAATFQDVTTRTSLGNIGQPYSKSLAEYLSELSRSHSYSQSRYRSPRFYSRSRCRSRRFYSRSRCRSRRFYSRSRCRPPRFYSESRSRSPRFYSGSRSRSSTSYSRSRFRSPRFYSGSCNDIAFLCDGSYERSDQEFERNVAPSGHDVRERNRNVQQTVQKKEMPSQYAEYDERPEMLLVDNRFSELRITDASRELEVSKLARNRSKPTSYCSPSSFRGSCPFIYTKKLVPDEQNNSRPHQSTSEILAQRDTNFHASSPSGNLPGWSGSSSDSIYREHRSKASLSSRTHSPHKVTSVCSVPFSSSGASHSFNCSQSFIYRGEVLSRSISPQEPSRKDVPAPNRRKGHKKIKRKSIHRRVTSKLTKGTSESSKNCVVRRNTGPCSTGKNQHPSGSNDKFSPDLNTSSGSRSSS